MKVLSIDVGIGNLAYCLFSVSSIGNPSTLEKYNINKWDVINLSIPPLVALDTVNNSDTFINPPKCNFINKSQTKIQKKPVICGKQANYYAPQNKDVCRCTSHAKKECYLIPVKELSKKNIAKLTMMQLCELADKYHIKYQTPIKKKCMITILNEYVDTVCFQIIDSSNNHSHIRKKINKNNISLINIGHNIKNHFNTIFKNIGHNEINYVVIENQITSRMKNIQCMIAQYFIMTEQARQIIFVSAIHKLQKETHSNSIHLIIKNNNGDDNNGDDGDDNNNNGDDGDNNNGDDGDNNNGDDGDDNIIISDKQKYANRKKMGIKNCIDSLLETIENMNYLSFFNSHKKKDDLADSYLQGKWFIKNKIFSN